MVLPRSAAVRGRRRGRPRANRGGPSLSIPVAVDDPASREVVRRELDANAVARRDADEVAAHASRGIRDQLVAAFNLHLEHCVGKGHKLIAYAAGRMRRYFIRITP